MATTQTRFGYRKIVKSYYTSDNFPSPTYLVNTDADVTMYNLTKTKNANPNWRVKVAKRQDASSDYFFSTFQMSNPPPLVTCSDKILDNPAFTNTGFCAMRWSGGPPATYPSTDLTVADIALARLKNKIASHQKDFVAMLPLAELRELRGLVRTSSELTIDFLTTLANIKRTRGASAFKLASQAWLTYGFGIAPLVADTKKASESIAAFLERNDHTVVLSGSHSKTWSTGYVTDSGAGGFYSHAMSHSHTTHSLSYRYKGGFNFVLGSANNYGVADHFHLKLPTLVPLAWELTPFSWIADYFSTVGAYLEDVFIGTPVKLLYLNRTRKYEAQVTNNIYFALTDSSARFLSKQGAVNACRYFEFERTSLSALPHRTLRFRTVDEVAQNSLNKLFNLMAVLGSGHRL